MGQIVEHSSRKLTVDLRLSQSKIIEDTRGDLRTFREANGIVETLNTRNRYCDEEQ